MPATVTTIIPQYGAASDRIFVYAPAGVTLSTPIQVINLVHSESDVPHGPPQEPVRYIGENADISLIICDHALSPGNS
ncbi:MAG: hypothetical protein R2744_01170 [Bacteroidales bacterium]